MRAEVRSVSEVEGGKEGREGVTRPYFGSESQCWNHKYHRWVDLPDTATPITPSLDISNTLPWPTSFARDLIIGCSSIANSKPLMRKLRSVVF